MAEGTIDSISIEVSSDAGAAVRSLNSLVTSLGKLETKAGTSVTKLASLSSAVKSLATAASGFDASGLKQLSEVKFSVSVAKNIEKLSTALASMPAEAVSKLSSLGAALKGLSGLTLSSSAVNQLAKLPSVLKEFSGLDVSGLASQMKQLTSSLTPLAAAIDSLATSYSKLPSSMSSTARATRSVTSANRLLSTSSKAVTTAATAQNSKMAALKTTLTGMVATIGKVTAAWYAFKTIFESTIGEVNDYIENMNLFNASMGEYAESAYEYGQTVSEALGIDVSDWVRNQGVFQTLITGMGDTAERANVMSQQLTQLGYDIASFYNISVEDAMLKIQSGISGELEPLRRLGWDLSQARLQLEATNLGIEESVSEMTQAEKVGLRYYAIMNQVTQVHGDMARTISSPANQLRVLQAQVTLAARAIGNLFIPALNAILPVVIGAVKALRLLAQSIADFFGIDVTFEVDYSSLDTSGISSGTDDVTDSLEDAADAADDATAAVEEYKNTVMGFDELNKLNAPTESSSSSSDSSGTDSDSGSSGLSIPLDTYDFLEGLTDYISETTDEIAEKIMGLMPYIAAVGAGLLAWKIASGLGADLKTCAGLAMSVAGAVIMVYYWLDMWNNGVDWSNLLGYLGGMALLVGGLALAFGPVAAVVGAVVGLLALGVASLKDLIDNTHTWANEIGTAISGLGLGAIGEEISRLAGKFVGPLKGVWKFIGALGKVVSVVGGVISAIDLVANCGYAFDAIQDGADISADVIFGLATSILGIGLALTPFLGWPALAVAAVVAALAAIAAAVYNNWDEICAFVSGIPEWFDTNVVQPVQGFFSGLPEFFSGLWSGIVGGISEWWSGVAQWFNDSVVAPMEDFFSPVAEFFSSLWSGIVSGVSEWWSGLPQWFEDNVVSPIRDFFSPLVEWFSELFGSIGQTAEDIFYDIGVFAEGCWTIVTLAWEAASGWFDTNIWQPLSSGASQLWEDVSAFARDSWDGIVGAWNSACTWFDRNIWQPLKGAASTLWGNVKQFASDCWNGISGTWNKVSSWFNSNVIQPVSGFFSGLWSGAVSTASSAWEGIKGVFSSVGKFFGDTFSNAWQQVCNVFSLAGNLFNNVKDAIVSAFKSVANSVIKGINNAVAIPFNRINSILSAMRSWEILGVHPFSGFRDISIPQIPYLAEGRYGIDAGQLFVARESGPEMVGQMGGHTTVANNQQIVEGIEAGVYNAVAKALATAGSSGGETTIEIPLRIGNEELARAAWKGQASLVRRGEIKASFA